MQSGAVVDPQFCIPEQTRLQIYQSCGDFHAENASDQLVFSVDKPFGCFNCVNRHVLRGATRVPLLCATRRMLDMRERRDVYRGDQYGAPDSFLFTVRRASYFSFNSNDLEVFLATNASKETIPDYKIEVRRSTDPLKVTRKGDTVATAYKSQVLSNCCCRGQAKYTIEVEAGIDQAFIVALLMICMHIKEPDETQV